MAEVTKCWLCARHCTSALLQLVSFLGPPSAQPSKTNLLVPAHCPLLSKRLETKPSMPLGPLSSNSAHMSTTRAFSPNHHPQDAQYFLACTCTCTASQYPTPLCQRTPINPPSSPVLSSSPSLGRKLAPHSQCSFSYSSHRWLVILLLVTYLMSFLLEAVACRRPKSAVRRTKAGVCWFLLLSLKLYWSKTTVYYFDKINKF